MTTFVTYNLALLTIDVVEQVGGRIADTPSRCTVPTPEMKASVNLYPGLQYLHRNVSSPGWPLTSVAYPITSVSIGASQHERETISRMTEEGYVLINSNVSGFNCHID